ncbi:MAG TPA: hypothetical protein VFQ00_00330 [Terriglobales bacterium]|nr:hypothetical protein [Terriglobales bacterium]
MNLKNKINRWAYLGVLAGLAIPATSFAAPPAAKPAMNCAVVAPSASAQASDLLKEIRGLAGDLSQNAEVLTLSSGTRQLHWQTHATRLNQAKDSINEIGARLDQLKAIRSDAHPWQQQAIDRIHASSLQAARNTEAALQYLNANQGWLLAPEYRDSLDAIQSHAQNVRETARDFLDYGKTSDRLETLQQRLEVGD